MDKLISREKIEFSLPEEGKRILFELTSGRFSEQETENIKKAYDVAFKAHADQKRLSGEPYINHPLNVAIILASLGMDDESIVAALLHDTVEDTETTDEDIKKLFGPEVAALVDGVTKIKAIKLPHNSDPGNGMFLNNKEQQQAENVRKLLMAMNQDVRVIIIKLADRLHNMRTLQFKEPQRRREIARETGDIYAPIAHRLGIRPVKEELEDLSISYLDPIAYKEIEDALDKQNKERTEYLDEIKQRILQRVSQSVSNPEVSGRIKSVHGIYRKMYMQNKDIDEIYDIYAVRIIVDTVFDCYNCLGLIHDMYKPIPGRFKDYISNPKANGYQSLHTTVLGNEGIPFEVQIRTHDMHHTAEYGVAAHWRYKLGLNGKKKTDEITWVKNILDNQKENEGDEDIVSAIKSDLVPEEVFVFSPKGEVYSLPSGATVIDFAYAVHSAVGNRMIGAKVDGRIVPIDYKVKTGQIVEILTTSAQGKGPARDWLNIVQTGQARTKIRQWFKKEKREENIEEGKEEIEREFRRSLIRLSGEELEEFLLKISERQHCNSLEDFYAGIGYGGISLQKLMPRIKDDYNKLRKSEVKEIEEENKAAEKKISKSREGVVVEGIDNCLVKFAGCCTPLPGDDIIGFITRGHGVSIHTKRCPNVPHDMSKCEEPERWITAYWGESVKEEFNCTLQIYCINRIGLLADISGVLSNMHIMINSISTGNAKNGNVMIYVTLSLSSNEQLRNIQPKLMKIKNVISVERSGK